MADDSEVDMFSREFLLPPEFQSNLIYKVHLGFCHVSISRSHNIYKVHLVYNNIPIYGIVTFIKSSPKFEPN